MIFDNMKEKKKVVVLMSTYNGEKYLRDQIDSILNQVGKFDVHILVRDDGSKDSTLQILDDYQNRDELVWYSDGENLGAARSFIRLLYNAPQAAYYAFSDQDDIWYKDKLNDSIRMLREIKGYGVVYTNATLVGYDLKNLGHNVFDQEQKMTLLKALCSCNAMGCTMVMNENLIQLLKEKDPPKNISMHDSFVCGVCMACGGTVLYYNESTMSYRQHGQNVMGYNINRNFLEKTKSKIKHLTKKRKTQIDVQAREIYKYKNYMQEANLIQVRRVINYRKNLFQRLSLAVSLLHLGFSRQGTKHEILNAITILLGNA